jgi:hypothetical protein
MTDLDTARTDFQEKVAKAATGDAIAVEDDILDRTQA